MSLTMKLIFFLLKDRQAFVYYKISLNDLNFFLILFFFIFSIFFINFKTTFISLIISELFWILLYLTVVVVAIVFDTINVLALSLFFLVFSAVEIALGLVLLVVQKNLFNTNIVFFKKTNLFKVSTQSTI